MNAPLCHTAFATGGQPIGAGAPATEPDGRPVVVIGAGPSGIRVSQELARRGLDVVPRRSPA